MPRDRLSVAALIAFFGLIFIALFGERIAPYEQIYYVVEHGKDPRPYDPGLVFPLGSDVLGRDLFSVVLAGARATLTIVLLAGAARVATGVIVAGISSIWQPARVIIETIADVVAAVPATLIAVLFIKAFIEGRGITTIPIIVGTLLLVGWAGPYRVLRAEADRLASAPFTEGAQIIGVPPTRVFWRHHVPHLVPLMAVNLSQQVVASLVLLAELGVLGVVLSQVRVINVEESLNVVRTGPPSFALVPDVPEWGFMLASARTVEILWATRWVIFIPGAAFAITAAAVALIGFALARRYARRDIFGDVRGGLAIAGATLVLFVASPLVPERYADAREWATAARADFAASTDAATAFKAAGLETATVTRDTTIIRRTALASTTVGGVTIDESYRDSTDVVRGTVHMRSLVSNGLGGGGTVEAPLVFAGRGIVPSEHLPPPLRISFGRPLPSAALPQLLQKYPDDYAGIDVRGKIVFVIRFIGIDNGVRGRAEGWTPGESIDVALKRGAAGVILVDPDVDAPGPAARASNPAAAATNGYNIVEKQFPPGGTTGAPVVVLDAIAAAKLVGPLGVDVFNYLDYDGPSMDLSRSPSRDLGITARISVPLEANTTSVTSLIAEVPGFDPEDGRIVVWARRDIAGNTLDAWNRDAMTSIARFAAQRRSPFIFVEYDPRADAGAINNYLSERHVLLVIILDRLDSKLLSFNTANGDLIPAFNLYADRAGVAYEVTRSTLARQQLYMPLPDAKTMVISSLGPDTDRRSDAVALVGYVAGRLALGAPELGR